MDLNKTKIINSAEAFKNHVKNLQWTVDEDNPGYYLLNTDQEGLLGFLNLEPSTMLNLNVIGLEGYLEECLEKNKLTKWIIAIKNSVKGKGAELKKGALIKEGSVNQTIRSGPSEGMAAADLFERDIFKVKNAQIISASDFSIGLDEDQKTQAVSEFRKRKEIEFSQKYKNESEEEIRQRAKKVSVPDFEYRKYMDESTGLLIIYPIQLDTVFETIDSKSSKEHKERLKKYEEQKGLTNLNVPLIGYAIGFPDVRGVSGGTYVTRHLSLDEMSLDELKRYVQENNIDIDLTEDWSKKELFLDPK